MSRKSNEKTLCTIETKGYQRSQEEAVSIRVVAEVFLPDKIKI